MRGGSKPLTPEQQLKKWAAKQKGTCLNLVADVLQELRRLEEADEYGYCICITSGERRKWNDGMQGGHFISRKVTCMKIQELNIWPQTASDNNFRDKVEMGMAYRKSIGEKLATHLEAIKKYWDKQKNGYEYTKEWLAEKIVEFRARIVVEKKRIENGEPGQNSKRRKPHTEMI